MKHSVCALLLSGAALPGGAAQTARPPRVPATGRTLADFVPVGYGTLRSAYATGDLNGDGRPDAAALLYPTAADSFDATPPQLIILLGTRAGYVLAARSAQAVLCAHCGGQGSNPFSRLSIRGGVLSIEHFTYTGWFQRSIARFRYQQNGFFLIGELKESGRNDGNCPHQSGPAGWNYHDTNFVTGEYEKKQISESCQLLVNRRGHTKPKPLRPLAGYVLQR